MSERYTEEQAERNIRCSLCDLEECMESKGECTMDICDWCGKFKEIVAERDSGIEEEPQKICKECAEFIGLEYG